MIRHPPKSTLFPYTPLFQFWPARELPPPAIATGSASTLAAPKPEREIVGIACTAYGEDSAHPEMEVTEDRKSTRLNSSHLVISYAVFCLKKKIIPQDVHTEV